MRRFLLAGLLLVGSLTLPGCGGGGLGDVLGTGGGSGGGGPPPSASMSETERAYADAVLSLVNQERASRGIGPVAWDEAAATAAYAHAVDMDVRDFFDHDNPDGDGPGQRLAAVGIVGYGWGENIARGQGSPESVMTAWMNSSGHRANILNAGYTHLGVGVHLASGGPWWVQDFVAR